MHGELGCASFSSLPSFHLGPFRLWADLGCPVAFKCLVSPGPSGPGQLSASASLVTLALWILEQLFCRLASSLGCLIVSRVFFFLGGGAPEVQCPFVAVYHAGVCRPLPRDTTSSCLLLCCFGSGLLGQPLFEGLVWVSFSCWGGISRYCWNSSVGHLLPLCLDSYRPVYLSYTLG